MDLSVKIINHSMDTIKNTNPELQHIIVTCFIRMGFYYLKAV